MSKISLNEWTFLKRNLKCGEAGQWESSAVHFEYWSVGEIGGWTMGVGGKGRHFCVRLARWPVVGHLELLFVVAPTFNRTLPPPSPSSLAPSMRIIPAIHAASVQPLHFNIPQPDRSIIYIFNEDSSSDLFGFVTFDSARILEKRRLLLAASCDPSKYLQSVPGAGTPGRVSAH